MDRNHRMARYGFMTRGGQILHLRAVNLEVVDVLGGDDGQFISIAFDQASSTLSQT